ncbi:MAG: hypothetical protein U1C96_10285 [Gallionella sp.]|nr:hypothetical protein [Gallionella sp.]
MNTSQTKNIAIFAALAVLMAATRDHHFGSALHLPDASLAIFLLAGFYLPRWAFPVLLVEAGLADYVAINYGGVSGWCFSPAYWFLIPTYFALWFGGRFYATRQRFTLRSLAEFGGIAFAATTMAFLISNISFYLFAPYFAEVTVAQYAAQLADYFPQYLAGAFLYLIPAALLHVVAVHLARRTAQQA